MSSLRASGEISNVPLEATKKNDFNKRLRTGLSLFLLLVIPMLYSQIINIWVLRIAIILGAIEWSTSGASIFGLVIWVVPLLLILDDAMDVWPGRYLALETLWIVLIYSDSAQLLVGRKFGRTPAIPSISPNKSVEGYIGGLFVAFLLAKLLHGWKPIPTMIVLIAGVFGDLYFSYFKRLAKLKDFSSILGPHGGICDRIDSYAFSLLFLYAWGQIVDESTKTSFVQGRNLYV
jgi:phosphatidate cytidylyltransferase